MRVAIFVLGLGLLAGCAAAPAPTLEPTSVAPPPAATGPSETGAEPSPTLALRSLPADVSGIPGPGQPSVTLQPQSPPGTVPVGELQVLELGHCGLGSPLDFDGSLWNPIGGENGRGGPLTHDQVGELINPTPVNLILLTPELAQIQTPLGAVVTLERLPGERDYYLCS